MRARQRGRAPTKPTTAKGDGPTAGAKPDTAPRTWQYIPCPPGFQFTGVVQRPDGALAAINGRFVRIGSKVNGAKVVRISNSSVEMELDGKRFLVAFGREKSRAVTPEEEETDEEEQGEKDSDGKDGKDKKGAKDEGKRKD
ncbi:MAG: hypothetical protein ACYS8K_06105 [Planctomycetota bacterium]